MHIVCLGEKSKAYQAFTDELTLPLQIPSVEIGTASAPGYPFHWNSSSRWRVSLKECFCFLVFLRLFEENFVATKQLLHIVSR